jgi:hypothetical protein
VNEVYAIDAQIDSQTSTSQTRLNELKKREEELRKSIELIECPRDDSLDNSIILWQSESFGALGGGGGGGSSESTGTGTAGESSVSSICNRLEDGGLMIRRCSEFDEVVSRVREMQADQKLRCLVSDSA